MRKTHYSNAEQKPLCEYMALPRGNPSLTADLSAVTCERCKRQLDRRAFSEALESGWRLRAHLGADGAVRLEQQLVNGHTEWLHDLTLPEAEALANELIEAASQKEEADVRRAAAKAEEEDEE